MTSWTFVVSVLALASLVLAIPDPRSQCAKDLRPCLYNDHASCHNDHCTCDEGYKGIGELRCVKGEQHVCTILNDPRATPFSGGKSADIPLPCRYLAADFTVHREDNFYCRSRIYAYGWRFKGKIYLIGYDIRLDWDGDSVDRYTLSLKAYGKLNRDGSFTWDLLTRHSRFQGAARWQREDISLIPMNVDLGGNNHFGIDEVNNRVQFYSSVCAIDTAFRLPNTRNGINQRELPGLFIAADPGEGDIVFNNVEGSACLNNTQSTQQARDAVDPALDIDKAFLYKTASFYRGFAFPNGPRDQCSDLQSVTSSCSSAPRRTLALNTCGFILQKPKFLHCYSQDDNSEDAIELFKECFDAVCTGNVPDFTSVKDKVASAVNCTNPNTSPEAVNFLASPLPRLIQA